MSSEQTVMIYHYTDWKGEKHMVRVAGTILVSYPSEHVYLVQTREDRFTVYYGLQTTEYDTLPESMDSFYHCCKHSMGFYQV